MNAFGERFLDNNFRIQHGRVSCVSRIFFVFFLLLFSNWIFSLFYDNVFSSHYYWARNKFLPTLSAFVFMFALDFFFSFIFSIPLALRVTELIYYLLSSVFEWFFHFYFDFSRKCASSKDFPLPWQDLTSDQHPLHHHFMENRRALNRNPLLFKYILKRVSSKITFVLSHRIQIIFS